MEKPKRRTPTSPGLGDSGMRARHVMPPTSGVHDRAQEDGGRLASVEERAPLEPASIVSTSEPAPTSESAPKISTRRAQSSRAPVRVDDVGDAAVAIASRVGDSRRALSAPKLLERRSALTDAPLDHRDAFVLSLIDGTTRAPAIVDMAAMPEGDVAAILERLARLGIIALG